MQTPDSEILIYENIDGEIKIDVRLEDETVWLTQEQMATLFGKGRSTITEHIGNVFKEGELDADATCRKFRQVRLEGGREIRRDIDYYNLDVIISVGYRVKSQQGTQFRIWATQRLRDYIIKGFSLNDEAHSSQLIAHNSQLIHSLNSYKNPPPPIKLFNTFKQKTNGYHFKPKKGFRYFYLENCSFAYHRLFYRRTFRGAFYEL